MKRNYLLYEQLGTHRQTDGVWRFCVYAPQAKAVHLIGSFNAWNHQATPLARGDDGVWQVETQAKQGDEYKYLITTKDGKQLYKADPFAFAAQRLAPHNSIVWDFGDYSWSDAQYLAARHGRYSGPLNIYEVHLGSWLQKADGTFYNYRYLAKRLVAYAKKMGYTHLELLPIMEHPFDGSWGYQVTGYFAPTSRYGTPADFAYFVNYAHEAGIGVILDWVPGHFPKDDFALARFDGSYLYEPDPGIMQEHKSWGTYLFRYESEYVQSFLISNARYWFDVYHVDGLRVDAVASMLYLNYDREKFIPNKDGGVHNLGAIDFLQRLNTEIFLSFPEALMIAEESTDYPGITRPVAAGGLGFNYKWNMGWMHDSLKYMEQVPHNPRLDLLTFSLMYMYSENYILPLSHDEVVHGKKSLVDKMGGSYDEKFSNLRLYFGYMMAHPGKKLTFMGGEFAQFIEWDEKRPLDWFLLDYPRHVEMQRYVKALNKMYLSYPQFWEDDLHQTGFEWIHGEDGLFVFKRFNLAREELLFVLNFYQRSRTWEYKTDFKYRLIFNSDKYQFGGTNSSIKVCHRKKGVVKLTIPPLGFLIYKLKEEGL